MRKRFIEEDKTPERLKAKGFDDIEERMQEDPELLSELEYETTKGLDIAVKKLSVQSYIGIAFGVHPNSVQAEDYCAAQEYIRKIFEIAPRYVIKFLEEAKIGDPLMKSLVLMRILGDIGNKADCDLAYQAIRESFEQVDVASVNGDEARRNVYLLEAGICKDIKQPQIEILRDYLAQKMTSSAH